MNFFKRIFSSSQNDQNQKFKLHNKEISEKQSNSPVQILLKEIKGRGRADYPFLHPTYSPSSRVPCIDFTNFFKDRLLKNDTKSIKSVMTGIIEGNPGIGIVSSWISEKVDEVTSLDFEKFIAYSNKTALVELKALWILAEKGGGGREFWITERNSYTKYFAVALSCYKFNVTLEFKLLIESANNFIKSMRKDIPYWETFPLYSFNVPQTNSLPSSKFSDIFNSLTIGARLHLYEALVHPYDSLTDCTNYNLRNIGVNSFDTINEIIPKDILKTSKKIIKISPLEYLTKKDLLSILDANNIDYKKSWNKDKLYAAIVDENENIIEDFMSDKKTTREIISYELRDEFKQDVEIMLDSVENTIIIYNLLSFIGSNY